MAKKIFKRNGELLTLNLESLREGKVRFSLNDDGEAAESRITRIDDHQLLIRLGSRQIKAFVAEDDNTCYVSINGEQFILEKATAANLQGPGSDGGEGDLSGEITAPMPGKLLKLFVSEGDAVEAGQPLFILEAMKMENEIKSRRAGTVEKVAFAEGELVSVGQVVVTLNDVK